MPTFMEPYQGEEKKENALLKISSIVASLYFFNARNKINSPHSFSAGLCVVSLLGLKPGCLPCTAWEKL